MPALECPQQGRLARAVAAHQRGDRSRPQLEVDLVERPDRPVRDGEASYLELPARFLSRIGPKLQVRRAPDRAGSRSRPRNRSAVRRRASRTVSGSGDQPASRPSSTSGGAIGESTSSSAGSPTRSCPLATGPQQAEPVGERNHPLEPVLRDEDGDAEVVDQSGERGEHVLGGGRVERGGRLVEHQQPRVRGEDGADGDPLLLSSGQGAQVAVAEVGDAEQVERLLDPAAHRGCRQPELLHPEGELFLDRVGDEPRGRVLPDVPDDVRPLPRRPVEHALPVDDDVAGQGAAGERRHQAGDHPEQGRLADAGGTGEQHQLAVVDGQVDVVEDRPIAVAEGDVAQLEHLRPPPPPAPRRAREGSARGSAP